MIHGITQVSRLALAMTFFAYGLDSFLDDYTFNYLVGTIEFIISAYCAHAYVFSWIRGEREQYEPLNRE